jgi:hypothetical protein
MNRNYSLGFRGNIVWNLVNIDEKGMRMGLKLKIISAREISVFEAIRFPIP